jgi:hypothetical protein
MPIGNLYLFSQERDFLMARERFSDESKGEIHTADVERAKKRD